MLNLKKTSTDDCGCNSTAVPTTRAHGTLVRPLYAPGLLLEDEDLTAAVDYTRHLTQLMFRTLFGCGVVCGLEIEARPECKGRQLCVKLHCGLALDCEGNPLEIKKSVELCYDPDCEAFPDRFWVVLCYEETGCRPRDTACGPDEIEGRSHTRMMAGVRIELHPGKHPPECVCACERIEEDDYKSNGNPKRKSSKSTSAPAATTKDDTKADLSKRREVTDCSCYDDHRNGVCPCCATACCVLVGRIDLKLDNDGNQVRDWHVGYGEVRRVRPQLIGMEECKRAEPPRVPPQPQPEV